MRKIFIDCGAHNGCSVRKFNKNFNQEKEYEIFSFEPNLKSFNSLKNEQDVNCYNAAVSTYDGEIEFYIHESDDYACTTYAPKGTMKNCGSPKRGKVSKTVNKVINLSNFIIDNFSETDFIILKLDVEGEEYNIIPHLIESGAIDYIDELFIEWHSRWLGLSNEKDRFYESLLKDKNIKVDNTWDAAGF